MKTKDIKTEQKSLLDSAKTETQVQDKSYVVAFRVALITLLFVVMFFSFLLSFSGKGYVGFGSKVMQGTFTAERFYNTKSCSLVVATKIDKISELNAGDEVFYSNVGRTGSAKFVSYDGVVVELENQNGESFTVNKGYVIGKVTNKIAVIGVFFALFQTGIAGIIAMVLLFVYTIALSLSKINYENTEEGRRLFALYKKEKAEKSERLRILKLMDDVSGVDEKIVEMLSCSVGESRKKFAEFENNKFATKTNKYEYVLYRFHKEMVVKKTLTRQERKCVSMLMILLCEVEHITQNIEYMLVDLLLKDSLVDFKEKTFESGISVLLSKEIEDQDILNLGSILYILFVKNQKIDKFVVADILLEYSKKADEMGKGTQSLAKNISLSISNNLK